MERISNILTVTKRISGITIIARLNYPTLIIPNEQKIFKVIESEFKKELTFWQNARRVLNAFEECYEVELIPPNKGLKDYYTITVR